MFEREVLRSFQIDLWVTIHENACKPLFFQFFLKREKIKIKYQLFTYINNEGLKYRMIKGGVLMYEDEWREYYATKNESIHITRNKLIFQCNEGISLSTHKTEIERIMHALALKLLLLELNSYDF